MSTVRQYIIFVRLDLRAEIRIAIDLLNLFLLFLIISLFQSYTPVRYTFKYFYPRIFQNWKKNAVGRKKKIIFNNHPILNTRKTFKRRLWHSKSSYIPMQ